MTRCKKCGWIVRDGPAGPMTECSPRLADACERRQALNKAGRPDTSACNCNEWPCACVCHGRPRYDADTGARIDVDDPRARALRADVDRHKK